MNRKVLVIIGAGGIGMAIARRQGAGKRVLLADYNENLLAAAASEMQGSGYDVATEKLDVASHDSVRYLAHTAAGMGDIVEVVHTAGVSPNMAPPRRVLEVDLAGTAFVLEQFGQVISSGGAGVMISSMAGYMPPPLPADQDRDLAHTPADDLLKLSFLQAASVPDSGVAYGLSKRANHLRVQAESLRWAERGARLNSISPGIIMTPLAREEIGSARGGAYRAMIDASPAKRVGAPEEVAAAAAYLLGSEAGFVTGADLLIDGGVIAALRSGRITLTG